LSLKKKRRKFEIQELKQKKKDLAKEKKEAKIVAEQCRVDERLEREKSRQEKDQKKQMEI